MIHILPSNKAEFLLALHYEYQVESYDIQLVKAEALLWERDYREFLDRDGRMSLRAFPHLAHKSSRFAWDTKSSIKLVIQQLGLSDHAFNFYEDKISRWNFNEVTLAYKGLEGDIKKYFHYYNEERQKFEMREEFTYDRGLFERNFTLEELYTGTKS